MNTSNRSQTEMDALQAHSQTGQLQQPDRGEETEVAGFRNQGERDRLEMKLPWAFFGTLMVYVTIEWMTSGDIAAMIANSMAPHFSLDSVSGEMPLWCRRAAGVAFVGAMLTTTLLTKLITDLALNRAKSRRAALMPGEISQRRGVTWGIRGLYAVKLGYIGLVAALYVWLWGFAFERSIIMAELSAQAQCVEIVGPDFGITNGLPEQVTHGKALEVKAAAMAAGRRLAGATGVFYSLMVLLHVGVLFLPVGD